MKKGFSFTVILIIFVLIGACAYVLFKDMNAPNISLLNKTNHISINQDIELSIDDISGVRSISVVAKKGTQVAPIYEKVLKEPKNKEIVKFNLKTAGLRDGDFDLEVMASDASLAYFGIGNSITKIFKMKLDSTPPRLNILSPPTQAAKRGSVAAVSFTSSKELQHAGVTVNNVFYPAFKQQNGSYYCLFPFRIEISAAQFNPEVVATDLAGNEAKTRVQLLAHEQNFKVDTLPISDKFLNDRMPDFIDLVPDAVDHLDRYIKVNTQVRIQNEKDLFELGKKTKPIYAFSDNFLRLPGSATRATFGDKRTYKYGDKVIDNQTHMGIDLASLRQAPVPAANTGTIVYADNMGIFGNLVIIDHGLGLMSLYSHLSVILVSVGESVTKGDTIGKTGLTGLAAGDHLHFGMLIHGIQIQPADWFDKNWVKNNITDRLK